METFMLMPLEKKKKEQTHPADLDSFQIPSTLQESGYLLNGRKCWDVIPSDSAFPSPLEELRLFGPEILSEFSLGVVDPRAAAQRLGFEAEPRLARGRVSVVAQRLRRRAPADVAGGGFGTPA